MYKISSFLAFSILTLSGCTSGIGKPDIDTSMQQSLSGVGTGVAVGAATGVGILPGALVVGAIGSIVGHNMQMNESRYLQIVDKLNSHGVKIIQNGDEVKFVLLASSFFNSKSPNLLESNKHAIALMSSLINHLPSTIVQITGFSDNIGSKERNYALSHARALAVKQYMRKSGVDSRLLYTAVGGELLPVVKESSSLNENQANRVEVTLNPKEHLNIG